MRPAIRKKIMENVSNFNNLIGMAQTVATSKINLGFPTPEKYPPTFVLLPQRSRPFIRVMRGDQYLAERKRKGLVQWG